MIGIKFCSNNEKILNVGIKYSFHHSVKRWISLIEMGFYHKVGSQPIYHCGIVVPHYYGWPLTSKLASPSRQQLSDRPFNSTKVHRKPLQKRLIFRNAAAELLAITMEFPRFLLQGSSINHVVKFLGILTPSPLHGHLYQISLIL